MKGDKAPHKPVLLLAIIDYIFTLKPKENLILIDQFLIDFFKINWNHLVRNDPFKFIKFSRPLFHLTNDGNLWKIFFEGGVEPTHHSEVGSRSKILDKKLFGKLDDDIFEALQIPEFLTLSKIYIYSTYFPSDSLLQHDKVEAPVEMLTNFEEEVLLDPVQKYGVKKYKYEGFLRSSAFRRQVMKVYEETCCISGLSVGAAAPVVEAAHIVDHFFSGNNSIKNGIALSANLHRAFDNGLIVLSEDYKIFVDPELKNQEKAKEIWQYDGAAIWLPKNERFWPSLEYISAHRRKYGFNRI